MKRYIALFRGINVGGSNVLPMRELVKLLEDLGLRKVKTYIQSGNAVFRSEEDDTQKLSDRIRAAVSKRHGFQPQVLLLEVAELEQAIASNPFPEAEEQPKTLHLYFLAAEPEQPDLERLANLKKDSERFKLEGKLFYLHAPDGIGRSKLAARAETALGVAATARNWRSVSKIMALARQSL